MELVTTNLTEGMEVKNLKELCKLMEIPINNAQITGNEKKAIIKEIDRYIDYEKMGQKYIITGIYEYPLAKNDARLNGRYVKDIELILTDYLLKCTDTIFQDDYYPLQDEFSIDLTATNWYRILGMCNRNYRNNSYYEKLLKKVSEKDINDFYFRENSRLERILFSSLNSLRAQRLIDYSTDIMLVFNEGAHAKEVKAGLKEMDDIREAEHDALSSFGYNKLFQVYMYGSVKKYYSKVLSFLSDIEKYGQKYFTLNRYYKVINVRFSKSRLINRYNQLLENKDIDSSIKEAIMSNNENVVDRLRTDVNNYYEKDQAEKNGIIKHTKIGKPHFPKKYLDEEFVTNHNILIDDLIKL